MQVRMLNSLIPRHTCVQEPNRCVRRRGLLPENMKGYVILKRDRVGWTWLTFTQSSKQPRRPESLQASPHKWVLTTQLYADENFHHQENSPTHALRDVQHCGMLSLRLVVNC